MTCSPRCAQSSAVLAVNTTRPIAAPGDAGSPFAIDAGRFFGSIVGCSTSSSFAGSTRITASFGVSLPSATRSTATFTIALPVRLPLRVCSMNSRLFWIVNSRSCMSRKWSSSSLATRSSSACAPGSFFASSAIGSGVRMPATTSSPCALVRNSPYSSAVPVAGLRVNATPVAQSSPRLPNTIACTLTAVPIATGMLFILR